MIVPLSSILFLVFFIVLKLVAWPHKLHPPPFREFLTAAAAWTVAFALRLPILYISTLTNIYVNKFTILVSTFLQVLSEEVLRMAVIVILGIHLSYPPNNDPESDVDWAPLPDVSEQAFTQVWWIAIGWATVDVAVGIVQGYEQLALYRDYYPDTNVRTSPTTSPVRRTRQGTTSTHHDAPQLGAPSSQPILDNEHHQSPLPRDLEDELSHLLTTKQRAELEEVYGSPLPRIPVFLIALQRLDAILLALGFTLLSSAAYLRALYIPSYPAPLPPLPPPPVNPPSRRDGDYEVDWSRVKDTTLPIFAVIILAHFFLSSLWMEALPRIGVHTASYIGLLVALAAFFSGMGYWGALV